MFNVDEFLLDFLVINVTVKSERHLAFFSGQENDCMGEVQVKGPCTWLLSWPYYASILDLMSGSQTKIE